MQDEDERPPTYEEVGWDIPPNYNLAQVIDYLLSSAQGFGSARQRNFLRVFGSSGYWQIINDPRLPDEERRQLRAKHDARNRH
ncbi:hypothetical protein HDU81_008589 [Chytriomyces hyalinus]|nr:hypothetical protein HDU81_008589 [Chytriomyces hyalinus]